MDPCNQNAVNIADIVMGVSIAMLWITTAVAEQRYLRKRRELEKKGVAFGIDA